MVSKTTAWAALAACALAASANASSTLLSDTFNNEPAGLFVTELANFTATRGDVDVLLAGDLGISDRGSFLDLDGSSGVAARLASRQSFALTPGSYLLSFDLAGSLRDSVTAPNTVLVSLGDVFSATLTKNFNDPFTSYSFPINVTTPTTAQLIFDHQGGDTVGALLDNVSLVNTTPTTAIPLPAAAWTGLSTLALLAAAPRLRRRRPI